jgi:hypothetical protein
MSSRYNWYDLILLALAGAIIYPDRVLVWIGEQRDRSFARWQIFLLEPVAIGLMISAMFLLMPICPRLDWWQPVIYVGVLGLVRFLYWLGDTVFRGFFDL